MNVKFIMSMLKNQYHVLVLLVLVVVEVKKVI
jgi:hypothetical protein